MNFEMKIVSSLEKCFWDDLPENKPEKTKFYMFLNERLSFQVMYRSDDTRHDIRRWNPVSVSGALAPYAKLRIVNNVLNMFPTYNTLPGGEFIKTEPGAYPDMIRPFIYPNAVSVPGNQTHAIWVDIELPEGFAAGEYDLSIAIKEKDETLGEVTANVTVVGAELPKQKLIHTEWFYTDCIANHYHVKAFSEKHWKLIESFMNTAVKNGINMIMTPLFTPELDTYVGGERLTTQLVDIELVEEGKFAFGFEKLHRWIDMALDCGVEYFEIPHFFTQWGAKAAPKIVVKVNGRKVKYFGWDTPSTGDAYVNFLDQFIPAIVEEFKKRGLDHKCYYHVSDEPGLRVLEHYKTCKEIIGKHLEGYPIIDALSEYEFYSMGAIERPAPNTRNAMTFVENGVPNLWVYHCGGGLHGVADRSISMPLWRTRILGVQLYLYNIEGFLHWGYNFYNSCHSRAQLDPFGYPDGGYFTPSGDCFLVYPGMDGNAWESMRLNALREAVDDMRALSLYEEKFGREAAEKLLLEDVDGQLTFKEYPQDRAFLINLREKIAKAFL
ncbi:MAG: DUF4091 domain-containing protein [Clostridia bacterium]|nr:DUF4091 domain-containing protein [Clostridia bacterium]